MSALRAAQAPLEHTRRTIHRQLVRMPVHALVEFMPDGSSDTPTHHGRVRVGIERIDADVRLSQVGRRGHAEPHFNTRESLVGPNTQFLLPMQAPVAALPPAGHQVEFRDFVERPLGTGTLLRRNGRGFAIASDLRAATELTVTVDLYETAGGHRLDLLLNGELKFLAGAVVEMPASSPDSEGAVGGAGDDTFGASEAFTVIEAGQTIRFEPRHLGLEGGAWGEAEVRFRFGESAAG